MDQRQKRISYILIMVCRGSFAVTNIMVPPDEIGFDSDIITSFDEVFSGAEGEQLLSDINRVLMHDSILGIAIVWKHIWDRFVL